MLRDEERALARQQAEESRRLALPRPKRTPEEQARIDAQVTEARARFGIPSEGLPPKGARRRPPPDDPHLGERIAADLTHRRGVNAQRAVDAEWKDWPAATETEIAAAQEAGIQI